MMTLEQIRKLLTDMNLKAVSRATGLNYQLVWRIANGIDKNPTYKTLTALSNYLESRE